MIKFFRVYLLPGFLFQSVVIAGGYATGIELVEFFLSSGPLGGLYSMLVTTLVWSLVIAASFELSRISKSYDYRSFFKQLLGRGWILYEIFYSALLLLILAVITKAAGEMLFALFDLPKYVGTLILMISIATLTFYGSGLIEKVLASWSFILYLVYFIFIVFGLEKWGDIIWSNIESSSLSDNWFIHGVEYAGYNIAIVPSILFCIRHLSSRKEALVSGMFAGVLAIIPAFCFYLLLVAFYPVIQEESVPVTLILSELNLSWFSLVFNIVIFGTFIETGTALLHAVNERISNAHKQAARPLSKYLRPVVTLSCLIFASYVGNVIGLSNLVAKGYGFLTYCFIAIFAIPVLTIGVYKILRYQNKCK